MVLRGDVTSELARNSRSEATSCRVHTWGEEKDNDDNYGDDVDVMLL